jgi:hypothetical protein
MIIADIPAQTVTELSQCLIRCCYFTVLKDLRVFIYYLCLHYPLEWLIQLITDCPLVNVARLTGLSLPLLCGHFVQMGRLHVEFIWGEGMQQQQSAKYSVEQQPFFVILLGLTTTKPKNVPASLPKQWPNVTSGQFLAGH